ncbi:MAG: glycosyltransferase family 4 protein [Candidatus Eisenbacteria bacterium]
MRVLLVHAFHYPRGGVERAALDESRWLQAAGHEVAHFAIRDERNLPSPTAAYFAPHAEYGERAPLLGQLAQLPRAIWSRPAAACMERLLAHWRPDLAHVHAPSRYLTPSVLRPLERAQVPMVMTLHDFKPWCTNRTLFAHGEPCTRCRGGRHWHAFAVGCVQDSPAKSAIGALEAYVHDLVGAYRGIRLWIAPSAFARDMAVDLGLDATRVRVVPHGLEPPSTAGTGGDGGLPAPPYALYAGRLSLEKGVRLLPAIALRLLPATLVVAGEGPLGEWLTDQARSLHNLKLVGHLSSARLARAVAGAAAVLVPSLSYETFCFAAAEALNAERPVVASRIGAIPELVEHEVTGLLAAAGDAAGFSEHTLRVLRDPAAPAVWAAEGRRRVRERTDPERHIAALLECFRAAGAPGG